MPMIVGSIHLSSPFATFVYVFPFVIQLVHDERWKAEGRGRAIGREGEREGEGGDLPKSIQMA